MVLMRGGIRLFKWCCRHGVILVVVLLEESSSREQTPLDPAVSPWRVTGLWINLLSLKMEISLLRRGEDLSKILKIQLLSNWQKSCFLFSERVQQQRADSPGPSCVSMKSDHSMRPPPTFKDGNQSIEKRWGFFFRYNKAQLCLHEEWPLYKSSSWI